MHVLLKINKKNQAFLEVRCNPSKITRFESSSNDFKVVPFQ